MTNRPDRLRRRPGLDVLSDMLRSVRLTGAMLFLVEASTPWVSWAPQAEAFRRVVLPAAQHLISLHIVTHGGCWAGLTGAPPERFETGDVLVIPHGDAYYLADPPEAERTYGHDEAIAFFRDMAAGRLPSTVIEGGNGPGRCAINLRLSRLRLAALQSRPVRVAAPASRPGRDLSATGRLISSRSPCRSCASTARADRW